MVTTYTRRFGPRGSGSLVQSLKTRHLYQLLNRSIKQRHALRRPHPLLSHASENVRLGFIFRRFNFRGSSVNCENWLPRKFPAIQ